MVLAAMQRDVRALRLAADEMLEDPTFATEAKRQLYLLKLTMLSGRSTVVAASWSWSVEAVLDQCRNRLGLADEGTSMELWHSADKVPDDGTNVRHWPGVQPRGQISEYQLVVTRR
eukprot:3290482-Amphidinium_carterae.1